MSSRSLRLLLDDNAVNFKFGSDWERNVQPRWYQGSTNFPAYNRTTFGSFNLSFQGTSIAFIGNTPALSSSQIVTVSIDGGEPYNTSYSVPAEQTYMQWYQSPLLGDGMHSIAVDHLDGTAIDMALITVEGNTSLVDKNVFVDNNDPAINYSGAWVEDTNTFHSSVVPGGLPVGNSTQRSTTLGDTMTFRFFGTSIALYGIMSWDRLGSISAAFTLDGDISLRSYFVDADAPQRGQSDAPNFIFYSHSSLSPGAHTLVVNVTDLVNQTFVFDYLTYEPSFPSLAQMPVLPEMPATMAVALSTADVAGVSPTISVTPSLLPTNGATTEDIPVGAVVGSVMAGVVIIALLVGGLIWLGKKPKMKSPGRNQSAYTDGLA